MLEIVSIAALTMSICVAILLVIIAVRRIRLLRGQQRRAAAVDRLRDAAVELVVEGTPPENVPPQDADLLAEVLWRYSRQLTGDSRERIAAYFEEVGLVDRQLAALTSRRAWQRAQAAFGLGDTCSPRGVAPLIAALDDPDRAVRAAATRSLGRLKAAEAVRPLAWAAARRRVPAVLAGSMLLEIGPPALPQLLELADHPDPAVRGFAIELTGYLGGAGEADRLIDHLVDVDPTVRASACLALGRLGADQASHRVRSLLTDLVPSVRAAAAEALGEIGDPLVADYLLHQARHDEFEPAHAAAVAVARLAPHATFAAAVGPDPGPHLLEQADLLRGPAA